MEGNFALGGDGLSGRERKILKDKRTKGGEHAQDQETQKKKEGEERDARVNNQGSGIGGLNEIRTSQQQKRAN